MPIKEDEDEDGLPLLRRLFAREIKRNLFDAYLRPRETIISLVSTSISSSSAPGGEAFHYSLSPRGHYVLAYSSSRIHVIDVTGPEVCVKRELKILRRPASTTITDDGSLLAVLSTDLQVDLYDLTGEHPKHTRAVALDHTPRTIALSPKGSVLAAAYDSGVEVSSLDPGQSNTERRAVKCYAVDSLAFSQDGTQLLGSTVQSRSPSTVVLTAPYYDPGGSLPDESVSALWTTSILFPNGSRDCSHAVLLANPSDGEATWTFTYDRVFETFRAVRIDDLRNGTTYFTGPMPDSNTTTKLLPSTLPAANQSGELVASGFQGDIWLYGVPEDLDAPPTIRSLQRSDSDVSTPGSYLERRNSAPSLRSVNRPRESISRTPQWQLLCDRFRNTFVEGKKIGSLDRVSAMTWVQDREGSSHRERLVAVAPGFGGHAAMSEDDSMNPTDGGRISILDFDYSFEDGNRKIITIEVGLNEPEVLEEEHRDLDAEVAIVRRRTVAQRRGDRSHVARSATTVARPSRDNPPPMPTIRDIGNPYTPVSPVLRRVSARTNASGSDTGSVDEDQDTFAFDAPYSHTSPRSVGTLRRAATAAAVNRRFNPRAGAGGAHIEYRRADGREEHPHESDADNWVPPPPPYTKEAVPPLPEHIQRSIIAEAAAATLQRSITQRSPSLDFPGLDSNTLYRSRTIASTSTAESRRERFPFNRRRSDSTTFTNTERASFDDSIARPTTSPVLQEFDDIYDVSPPGSPHESPELAPRPVAVNQIPRRPVPVRATSSSLSASGSPEAVMSATLQKPVSPIPEPTQPLQPNPQNPDHEVQHWESISPEEERVSPVLEVVPSPPSVENDANSFEEGEVETLNKELPPRPDNNHHLIEPPSTAPISRNHRDFIEFQPTLQPRRSETVPLAQSPPQDMQGEPIAIWRRVDTAPAALSPLPNNPGSSLALVMPSADQLARLNSRKGRPSGATDPRRASGNIPLQQRPSSSGQNGGPSWDSNPQSIQYSPSRLHPDSNYISTPPRTSPATRGSSPQRTQQYPPNHYLPQSYHNAAPSRSLSHSRNAANHSPGLRPPMQRLETIHSQTSDRGEPSPFFVPRPLVVSRQPSRAERSAAKNIKDAKKKGWRAMRKEGKKGRPEEVGADGWTNVGRQDIGVSRYGDKEKKKDGKCALM